MIKRSDIQNIFFFVMMAFAFDKRCSFQGPFYNFLSSYTVLITGLDSNIFESKIVNIFLPINFSIYYGCLIWVLKRTLSLRRFFCVPTTYVLVEK